MKRIIFLNATDNWTHITMEKLTFDRKTSNITKRIVSKYREGFYKETCLNRKKTAKFWRCFTADLIVIPQWNCMCYYTKVYFNSITTLHKKYRKQNKQPKRKSNYLRN